QASRILQFIFVRLRHCRRGEDSDDRSNQHSLKFHRSILLESCIVMLETPAIAVNASFSLCSSAMRRTIIGFLTFLIATTVAVSQSKTHDLKLEQKNIHWGYYDAKIPPALRIASGDTVRVETMIAGGLERLRLAGIKEEDIPESLKVIENTVKERGPGPHPMTGPTYVEGALPGDTLEVHFISFDFLHPFGVTAFSPGGGTLPNEFPYAGLKIIRINERAGTGDFGGGITLKLSPFFGSIGVAPPPLMGRISSRPPGPQVG